jgi:hypothetical protein
MSVGDSNTPKQNARYRKIMTLPSAGARGGGTRTLRIACYNPRRVETDCVVSLGIGPMDPDAFSQAAIKVTEETWNQIDASMREALKAAK